MSAACESTSSRSDARMREKCRHSGLMRKNRPSSQAARLKWFATDSCQSSRAATRKAAARSMRNAVHPLMTALLQLILS